MNTLIKLPGPGFGSGKYETHWSVQSRVAHDLLNKLICYGSRPFQPTGNVADEFNVGTAAEVFWFFFGYSSYRTLHDEMRGPRTVLGLDNATPPVTLACSCRQVNSRQVPSWPFARTAATESSGSLGKVRC